MPNNEEQFEVRDLRPKGWFWLNDEFFNGYAGILGANALAVYVALARHADKKQKCYPKQQTIADETKLNRATVNLWIQIFEYMKIIKKQRVGKQCANRYYLLGKKYWRKDWDVMLREATSGDVAGGNKRCCHTLHQVLPHASSNRKETQLKQNTKERNRLDKPTKRSSSKFSKDWYDSVLKRFCELKDIAPQKREWLPLQQECKSMFLSGRVPKDILACMEFMAKDEFYQKSFTLKTIRMKLPEFLAGKLHKKDKVPPYFKDWKMPKS